MRTALLLKSISAVWILIGCVVALAGLGVTVGGLAGGGVPVGGAGLFLVMVLILGPIALLSGIGIVICGIRLRHGQCRARRLLEILCWIASLGCAGYAVYAGIHGWAISVNDTIAEVAAIVILLVLPSSCLLLIMRSSSIRRAMSEASSTAESEP